MRKIIYTVGTSNRTPDEFVDLLNHYRITAIVDVRRFPTSKFEWFKKENLAELLSRCEIEYIYLGEELGGYRSGGYEIHMRCDEFIEGRMKAEKIAKHRMAAIMCAERLPWRCHRRFIARSFVEEGWRVIHIIDGKRTWEDNAT